MSVKLSSQKEAEERLTENQTHKTSLKHTEKVHSNIILKNKIIKLNSPCFNLRSLALEVKLDLLMSGESTLYIFSRSPDELSSEMAVCAINKDLESSRKFINFSIIEKDEENLIIKALKKQEIPRQSNLIRIYSQITT